MLLMNCKLNYPYIQRISVLLEIIYDRYATIIQNEMCDKEFLETKRI